MTDGKGWTGGGVPVMVVTMQYGLTVKYSFNCMGGSDPVKPRILN